jgi:hypothetical protein
MKTKTLLGIILFIGILISCKKEKDPDPVIPPGPSGNMEVIINDIPYPTEKYLRIGYTLKMWEYEKDGLRLMEFIVQDDDSKAELMKLDSTTMPLIYKYMVDPIPFFTWDSLHHFYTNIQLPIPHGQPVPNKISHKLKFYRPAYNDIVTIEGGAFVPRTNEFPIIIASPVKRNHWIFNSQSTMGYHFYTLFFTFGDIYTGERFAFDNGRANEELTSDMTGDSIYNESYICYGDTLYAVADGKIVDFQDGILDNNGNQPLPITCLADYPGNYVVLEIDATHYAAYCHCQPGKFFVQNGEMVTEGQPLGLLGNSGNSGMPHLHFQIMDRNNIFFSSGLPFVLKEYKKINELNPVDWTLLNPPVQIFQNKMMEMLSIVDFEY